MATIIRRANVGEDIRSLGAPWQIAGITVDNPSGSWLLIPNIGNIPPYTMGWATSPVPTVMVIDVLFSESPSGSPSTLTGQPITVTISDDPVGESNGLPSGAQQSDSPIGAGIQFSGIVLVDTTPNTLLPVIDGTRIVPIRLTVSYNMSTLGGSLGPSILTPRGVSQIHGSEFDPATTLADTIFTLSISPEAPAFEYIFTAGYIMPSGTTLRIQVLPDPSIGQQIVAVALQYYRRAEVV